jgi:SAM-dependent methyltransferase
MTPLVFDRDLVRRRLARAVAAATPGADFLLSRVVEEAQARLGVVLRRFAVALDLGAPTGAAAAMLRASGKCGAVVRAAPGPPADVRVDLEALPFRAASLDLVLSLAALHTANDLPGVFAQVRRALAPDGLFLAAIPGGATLVELREAFALAESEVEGGASPRVAPFLDVRAAGALLQRAGFALPVADVESIRVRYADPFALMRDLRAMGATNALVERRRAPLRRATLLRMAELYRDRFGEPDGRVPATFEVVWASGWAPHESQQKPLAPGSAKARLADALGVAERSAGEKPGG